MTYAFLGVGMATITKEGVNRVYISNHDIPRHYQG